MSNQDQKRKVYEIFRSLNSEQIAVSLFAIILGFIGIAATDIYLPSMPSISLALHASKAQVQLTIAIFLVGCVFLQPFYGIIADKYGRKSAILIGMIISIIGFLLAACASDIKLLLIARFIQGAGVCVAFVMFRVLICDVITGKKLPVILSYGAIIFSLSPILAPMAGGYIEAYLDWRFCFWILSVIYVIYIILFIIFCPKIKYEKKTNNLLNNYKRIFKSRLFLAGSFAGGIGYSFIMAYATTASFIFQKHFLLSPVVFGWLGIFIGATNILGKHYNAVLSLKISLSKLLMLGNLIVLVGGLLLLIFSKETNFLTALIPITLCTFGIGFIMGNAIFSYVRISRNKRLVCISLWYGTNTPVFYYKHDHFVFCKIQRAIKYLLYFRNMRDDLFNFAIKPRGRR